MQASNPNGKSQPGINADKGKLRISLPRYLFDGKRKYVYLNMSDTPRNRILAEEKAKAIESDILFGCFDFSAEDSMKKEIFNQQSVG